MRVQWWFTKKQRFLAKFRQKISVISRFQVLVKLLHVCLCQIRVLYLFLLYSEHVKLSTFPTSIFSSLYPTVGLIKEYDDVHGPGGSWFRVVFSSKHVALVERKLIFKYFRFATAFYVNERLKQIKWTISLHHTKKKVRKIQTNEKIDILSLVQAMILILDGKSEIGAHVRRDIGYLIC